MTPTEQSLLYLGLFLFLCLLTVAYTGHDDFRLRRDSIGTTYVESARVHQSTLSVCSSPTRIKSEQILCRQLSSEGTASPRCQAKTRLNDLVFTAWATLHRPACPRPPCYPACSSLRRRRGQRCYKVR